MKRKKIILLIFFSCLAIPFKLRAQSYYYPNQISLQYGIGTLYQFVGSAYGDGNGFGPVGITYHHSNNPKSRKGFSILYNAQARVPHESGFPFVDNVRVTLAYDYLRIYHSNNKVNLYGKVSVGINLFEDDVSDIELFNLYFLPSTAIVPFGLEVGNPFCGFFEIGFGHQGIIACGMRTKF